MEGPSGTVTFLFTDIEGSTRLWEVTPAAMAVALRGVGTRLPGSRPPSPGPTPRTRRRFFHHNMFELLHGSTIVG
jgi:hypothetical protein